MKGKLLGIFCLLLTAAFLTVMPGFTQGTHNVTLHWGAPVGGGPVVGYNIYRGTATGAETMLGTSTSATYVDSTGTQGATYFYQVAAFNSAGTGPISNEISATFLVDKPGAVTGLTAVSN